MTFNTLLNAASFYVGYHATSNLTTWTNMIFTVFGFVSVLLKEKQIKLFLLICGMNIISHFVVTKLIGKKINKMIMSTNSLYKEEEDAIQLEAYRIHTRENRHDNMMSIKIGQTTRNQKINLLWNLQDVISELPNYLVYLAIPYVTVKEMINPVVMSITSINNTISSFSEQISHSERDKERLISLEKFWDNKTFNDPIPQVDIIPDSVVFDGSILDGKVQIQRTVVNQHERIHMAGPSGGGKTSILRGLIDYLPGIHFENGDIPGAYASRIAYMRQDMAKTTPFTNTTLRQLFYDEPNNDIII
jgi:hypothetical protein